MNCLTDKRNIASKYILSLILDCTKHEVDKIHSLSHAFTLLNPEPEFEEYDLDEEGPQPAFCPDTPIPFQPVDPMPPVEVVPDPVAAPAPAPAKKAPAKKAAAKPAPAPVPAQEAASDLPGALAEPTENAVEVPTVSPAEAERLRQLVRDTFVARTKLIGKDDPDNTRKIDFTAKFTALVESYGSKTVSATPAENLPALLDAMRAIQV